MIRKVLYLFGICIIINAISACGWLTQECGNPSSYTVNYTGVNIDAYNTAGFQPNITTDFAYKTAFGLTISSQFDQVQTAYDFNLSVLSSAYALSCVEPSYTFSDPIHTLRIYMREASSGKRIDVTPYFGMPSYYNEEYLSIDEFLAIREPWDNYFQLELLDPESVPNEGSFIAELHLESGNIFTEESERITFLSKK